MDLQVRKAIDRGDFRDLPGYGKPLRLTDQHDPDSVGQAARRAGAARRPAALGPAAARRRRARRPARPAARPRRTYAGRGAVQRPGEVDALPAARGGHRGHRAPRPRPRVERWRGRRQARLEAAPAGVSLEAPTRGRGHGSPGSYGGWSAVPADRPHPGLSSVPPGGYHSSHDPHDRRPGYLTAKDDYLKRLRRIEGQARGLQRMVEEEQVLHRHPHPGLRDDQGAAGRLARPARGAPAPLRASTPPAAAATRPTRRSPRPRRHRPPRPVLTAVTTEQTTMSETTPPPTSSPA